MGTFIPSDEHGDFINLTISNDALSSIDLFIFTTEDDFDDGSSDNGNDDSSDDSNDGTDDDDSSDDSDDSSDDENDDSDGDDSDSQNTSCVKVEMLIWDDGLDTLVNDVAVDIGEIVRFNVSIEYNGSFTVSNVNVLDTMPEGLEYAGNATVDGINDEPTINETNHSLLWNISTLASNQTMFIEFNCSVSKVGNHTNLINVTGKENATRLLANEDAAYVEVYGSLVVGKFVWSDDLGAWADSVAVDVYEIVRFNVSIEYNGSFMVSDVAVLDMMPEGLEYAGNATVDGVNDEPTIDGTNHSLLWNI